MNPIATPCLAALAASLLSACAIAQPPPRLLRCEPPMLDAFVAAAERDLESAHAEVVEHASPDALAGAALGWLRLGREDRAIPTLDAMLARCEACAREVGSERFAWAVMAHHWATRVLGDDVAKRSGPRLLRVAECLVDARSGGEQATTMREAALRAHALDCASDLARRLDDASLEHMLDAAARRALGEFESAFWSEPILAFSAAPTAHDADALFPCTIGMLASTEGRAERSLRATLAASPSSRVTCCDRLVAKAQLAAPLADELAELLANRAGTDADPGRRLDAAMFALTGSRVATGPGIDAQWMRLRPCLPRGIARMRVEGLSLDGFACAFEFEADANDPTRTRGVYRIDARTPRQASWRQLVVHHGDHAFVTAAIDGEPIELPPRELPVTSPDVRAR